jgi:mRNA deadenylase 3'-5' endonuclease subunit Ccr4
MDRLVSATGWPLFTNHVPGFFETLDYVFVSGGEDGCYFRTPADGAAGAEEGGGAEGYAAAGAAPMPDEEAVRRGGAAGHLPGELFPSDHVSVACDLELRL